jgi:hypothetical protein
MKRPQKKGTPLINDRLVRLATTFVVVGWLLNLLLLLIAGWDSGHGGTFGDRFGAVNALFSGLAFVGIIYSLLLQRQDLRNQQAELQLQREEMKLQRVEMGMQREELARSRISLERQSFEDTLFRMIENHRIVTGQVNGVISGSHSILETDEHYEGNDYFTMLQYQIQNVAEILTNHDWVGSDSSKYSTNQQFSTKAGNLQGYRKVVDAYEAEEAHFQKAKESTRKAVDIAYALVNLVHEGEFIQWWNDSMTIFDFLLSSYRLQLRDHDSAVEHSKSAIEKRYKFYMDLLTSQMHPAEIMILFHHCQATNAPLWKYFKEFKFGRSLTYGSWTLGSFEGWGWVRVRTPHKILAGVMKDSEREENADAESPPSKSPAE